MRAWRPGTRRFSGNDGREYWVTAYPSREHVAPRESPHLPIDGPPDYRTSGGQRVLLQGGAYLVEATGIVLTLIED
jgi:hypothetical protein